MTFVYTPKEIYQLFCVTTVLISFQKSRINQSFHSFHSLLVHKIPKAHFV